MMMVVKISFPHDVLVALVLVWLSIDCNHVVFRLLHQVEALLWVVVRVLRDGLVRVIVRFGPGGVVVRVRVGVLEGVMDGMLVEVNGLDIVLVIVLVVESVVGVVIGVVLNIMIALVILAMDDWLLVVRHVVLFVFLHLSVSIPGLHLLLWVCQVHSLILDSLTRLLVLEV